MPKRHFACAKRHLIPPALVEAVGQTLSVRNREATSHHLKPPERITGFRQQIRNDAGQSTAEIFLYTDIGPDWWGGISAQTMADTLAQIGTVDVISLRINSPGGDAFDAFAMYNMLVRNTAQVVVDIDGSCFSAATIVAMAGDQIRMAENAMMMIHDPSTMVWGTADDMRSVADTLDLVRDNIAVTYAKRSGSTALADFITLMSDETYLSAQQSKEYGLVDEVTPAKSVSVQGDPLRFPKLPKAFRNRMKIYTPVLDLRRSAIERAVDVASGSR